jgi:NCS1 family nucleobase:cation symporter-1
LIKKGTYDAEDILFDTKGRYRYQKGVNVAAYVTYIIGAVFAYYFTYIHPLTIGSTILTFLLSGAGYWGLMKVTKQTSSAEHTIEL